MKDSYVQMLRDLSKTREHEAIIECLDYYDVDCLMDVSDQQAENFIRLKKEEQ